ncbi:MAG: Ig-like domain repeat protein [Solirubrobacteraceae bacterium]
MGRTAHAARALRIGGLAALALMCVPASALGAASPRQKLDGHLQALISPAPRASGTSGSPHAASLLTTTPEGVYVDVYVTGDVAAAASTLSSLGMAVTATSDVAPERMVEGYLPAADIATVAALPATRSVVPVMGVGTNAMFEGTAPLQIPAVQAAGHTGQGVSVGIISDSMNFTGGLAASQAGGFLPPAPNVKILEEGTSGHDEGRAMAEIVFNEAPGLSSIVFHTGAIGAADQATGIQQLAAAGVKVIADDIFHVDEPFFQEGAVARAVDAAKAAGVAFFVSVGNHARQSYEGTFAADAQGYDTFPNASASVVTVNGHPTLPIDAALPAGKSMFDTLQWAEPWGAATDSFSATLVVTTTGQALTPVTNASGMPVIQTGVMAGGSTVPIGIQIQRTAGTVSPFIKLIAYGNHGTFTVPTSADAVNPDAASALGSVAVGAVDCHPGDTPTCTDVNQSAQKTVENFSSRGPHTLRFDTQGKPLATPLVEQRPQIAAPDGITTDVSSFQPFYGTSASAPSAAGVAALLIGANPTMPVDETYAIMERASNAIPCSGGPLPDPLCGAGFIQANSEMAMALDTTPPLIGATTTPAAPNGANGWFTSSPVNVTWTETDLESPVVDPSGCDPSSVSTSGSTTLACSATSAGGITHQGLTVKIDTTPPTTPAIAGVGAQSYPFGSVPSGVSCTSSDPESQVSSCAVSGLDSAIGSHTLTATATNGAGLTSTSTLTYSVTSAATATRLAASPSAAGTGAPVTFTATVTPAPDGGTVGFSDGIKPISGCVAVPLTPSGAAACTAAFTTAGTHTVTASYSGTTNYAASTATGVAESISWSLSLAKPPKAVAGAVTLPLACAAGSGGCTGTVTLTYKSQAVGTQSVRLAAGASESVKVNLNRAGRRRRTHAKRHRLTVTVVLASGGSIVLATKVTITK